MQDAVPRRSIAGFWGRALCGSSHSELHSSSESAPTPCTTPDASSRPTSRLKAFIADRDAGSSSAGWPSCAKPWRARRISCLRCARRSRIAARSPRAVARCATSSAASSPSPECLDECPIAVRPHSSSLLLLTVGSPLGTGSAVRRTDRGASDGTRCAESRSTSPPPGCARGRR